MEFLVRECVPGDERALSHVGRATILETYAGTSLNTDLYSYVETELSPESFRSLIVGDRSCAWIAEARPGNCAVGYALVRCGNTGRPFATSELERLYLFHRFHRLGLGKRLMDRILAHAVAHKTSAMSLRVNTQNASAIGFYERYGFSVIAEEPFRAGSHDYRVCVMRLALAEQRSDRTNNLQQYP